MATFQRLYSTVVSPIFNPTYFEGLALPSFTATSNASEVIRYRIGTAATSPPLDDIIEAYTAYTGTKLLRITNVSQDFEVTYNTTNVAYNSPNSIYEVDVIGFSSLGTVSTYTNELSYDLSFELGGDVDYEFSACCDGSIFRLTGYTGSTVISVNNMYYLNTDCYQGCAIAITPTGGDIPNCGLVGSIINYGGAENCSTTACSSEFPCVTPTPTVTPSPTPDCECYYQDLDININDIINSTGNSIYDNSTVYVRYIVCGGGIRIDKYKIAGTYCNAICVTNGEQASTQLYFYQNDTQFPAESTYSDTSNCCSAPPTPTPTATANVTPTPTSSITPTPTTSLTPTNTPSETPSVTPTNTPSGTPSVTPTNTPSGTPSVTPTNTPSGTPSVTPSGTPNTTPNVTPTPGCGCAQIDLDLPVYATGNTLNPDLNNKTFISYNQCDGTPVIYTAVTATADLYLCALNGQIDLVEFYQNNIYYSSSTFPWSPPIETPFPSQGNFAYAIYGTCSGDPCGPFSSPSPTPTITADVTPTPTPSITPSNTPSGTPSVTPTPTNTPSSVPVSPCAAEYCVDINIDAYSGYNGTYYYYQQHNGKPSWTGGTLPGYIFYKSGSTLSTNWCLSDSYVGDCIGSGPISPFCDDECPDFDPTIVLSGSCSPTPVDPCSSITIDADFYCNYTPGTTPLPTPSITPTTSPTPTPTDSTCAGFSASVSVIESTPQPTPTPTQTPTPTFARTVNTGGTVNFVIDSGDFVCFDVKELSDCDSGILYYISGNLKYNGLTISTGTTIQAYLNNEVKCLTYQRDVNGSATAYLGQITNTGTTCSICAITPTPSMTSSLTPTPTLTPSPTPNPTVAPTTNFVFQSCVENKLVVQTQQPGSLTTGRIVKINNVCYTYLGSFTNYIPPVGYQVVNNNFITSTPATQYDNCLTCLTPPTVFYQVIKQTTNCQNTGSAIYVTKPSTVSTPSVGQYVKLSGSGYVGCWKVIGTSSSGPASTTIIDVHNQCDCSD